MCATLNVRWLDPGISKAAVQEAFEGFGAIKHVQICCGDGWAGVPKTAGRFPLTYNFALVTCRDKSVAVAARHALNGAPLLRSSALSVSFASGRADPMGDESENEFDESDLAPPDDPESDGMDDDFDDF